MYDFWNPLGYDSCGGKTNVGVGFYYPCTLGETAPTLVVVTSVGASGDPTITFMAVLHFHKKPLVSVLKNKLEWFGFHTHGTLLNQIQFQVWF